MKKYQDVFIQQLNRTLERWRAAGGVEEAELYRLLHSVKGTAGTIGLDAWSEAADRLLAGLDEESARRWPMAEAEDRLAPLLALNRTIEAPAAVGFAGGEPADAAASAQAGTGAGDQARSREEAQAGTSEATAAGAVADMGASAALDKPLVLLVEDDLALLQLLKERLEREGCMVLATPLPEKAMAWFYEYKPDCIVIGLLLPGQSGYGLLEVMQDRSRQYIVPVILMSAQNTKESRIRAFALGADDFIAKPVDPDEFAGRVLNKVRRKRMIGALMFRDGLTGLYNPQYMRAEWPRLVRGAAHVYAALLDIDGFRRLNERYGPVSADALLYQTAEAVRARLRADELAVRWEKDRFMLILQDKDAGGPAQRLREIVSGLAEARLPAGEDSVRLTATAAFLRLAGASVEPDACAAKLIIRAAQGKRQGPGGVHEAGLDAAPSAGRRRIAVVDDDALIRSMLERRLKDMAGSEGGRDIECFADGEAFFEKGWADREGEGLIILDRMMPRMNGIEVLTRLRAEYPANRFRILMLTGVNEEKEIAQALRLGTDDYVTKPFRLPELEARIRRLLEGTGA